MVKNNDINFNKVGSVEFQVIQLSHDIKNLTDHLKKFKKDHHTKYGLIKKVSKKKSFLKYLKKKGIKLDSLEV